GFGNQADQLPNASGVCKSLSAGDAARTRECASHLAEKCSRTHVQSVFVADSDLARQSFGVHDSHSECNRSSVPVKMLLVSPRTASPSQVQTSILVTFSAVLSFGCWYDSSCQIASDSGALILRWTLCPRTSSTVSQLDPRCGNAHRP